MDILIGFLIMFVLSIITLIYWFKKNNKKYSYQVKNPNTENNSATVNNTSVNPHGAIQPKTNSSLFWQIFKVIIAILFIIGATILIIWAIITLNNSSKEDTPIYDWVEYKKEIPLNNEYGDVHKLKAEERFDFLNASHPYCVINGRGMKTEVCGEKGENICSELPQGDSYNNKLQFKLRDSDDTVGSVDLVIYRYEKIN